jgi:Sigma-70, region 4
VSKKLILDEEIGRLPEKQQAAIILCLVQGKTHETAAAERGCPLGTVKTRNAARRATLARKLARRGLAPSIGAGAASISENLMARSVPQDLVRQTLKAASRFAVSRSIGGAGIANSVQNLMEEVSRRMRLARMKAIVIGVAIADILVWAPTALVLAQSGRGRDAGDPKPVAKVAPQPPPPKLDLYGDAVPAGATMRFGTIRHRQESPIYRIAFTRDDRFLITDGDDSQLRVWDGHDGTFIRRIPVDIEALADFAVSADGKVVATSGTFPQAPP